MNIPPINFGSKIYTSHEGEDVYAHSYGNVSTDDFQNYIETMQKEGYIELESYTMAGNSFVSLRKNDETMLAAYYPAIKEMRIVTEPNMKIFEDNARSTTSDVKCTLTQIDLEDFGLSYVIRLSDGRFIIFDGGWNFEPDADKLMNSLTRQSEEDKPVVAAWIMTHPHIDHYRCFFEFSKKYSGCVTVERMMFNFPDANENELENIPALNTDNEIKSLSKFYKLVKDMNIPVFRVHTGQVFDIGNAKLEVLSSPDDTFFLPADDFNKISLVIKMTIEGQTILWTGDSYFKEAKLAERWGEYLKSDIFQIPHHGFCGGRACEFDLIDPHTCLAPVGEDDCFEYIDIYLDYNRHLIYDLNVREFFTGGEGNVVLTLPYSPRANAKKLLHHKIDYHQRSLGMKTWVFEGVSADSCDFTFINMTRDATVFADLIFDDPEKTVKFIKIDVPGYCITKKNILSTKDVDDDALFFNRSSLKIKGVEPGSKFAVRFKSDKPIVIKGKRRPDYSC